METFSRAALTGLRRAIDDGVTLAQAVRQAAIAGQVPDPSTVMGWLERARKQVAALADAFAILQPHVAATPGERRRRQSRSAQLLAQFVRDQTAELQRAFVARLESWPEPRTPFEKRHRVARAVAPQIIRLMIPGLVASVPLVTREDVLVVLKAAWPATHSGQRGRHAQRSNRATAVQGIYSALRDEHPEWSATQVMTDLAKRLGCDRKTVSAYLRARQ